MPRWAKAGLWFAGGWIVGSHGVPWVGHVVTQLGQALSGIGH